MRFGPAIFCLCFWIVCTGVRLSGQQSLPAKDGFLVQLKEGVSVNDWSSRSKLRSPVSGFRVDRVISETYGILLLRHVSGESNESRLAQLRQHPDIAIAQLNRAVTLRGPFPNDPFWDAQWNLERIGAYQVWEVTTGGKAANGDDIVLAILEPFGFDVLHEDLESQIWTNDREVPEDAVDNDHNGFIDDYQGWNAHQENDLHPVDVHGTNVAGILGAAGNNSLGISSASWNARLLLLSGSLYESEVVANYLYALELRKQYNETGGRKGAFIVATNASFGIRNVGPENFPIWCRVYDLLGEEGILNISAADNVEVNSDLRSDIPTSCTSEYLITVTGVDEFDQFLSGKAYGPETVDIAAPAINFYTTFPNDRYGEVLNGGNSYAAPHVTAGIGLLYSLPIPAIQQEAIAKPAETALKMKAFLLDGAEKLPSLRGIIHSEGRIDLQGSYELIKKQYASQPLELEVNALFPNPFIAELQIELVAPEAGIYTVEVRNLQGLILERLQVEANTTGNIGTRLALGHLPPGMYVLAIFGAGHRQLKKVVKLRK